jgi:hypothetical protein
MRDVPIKDRRDIDEIRTKFRAVARTIADASVYPTIEHNLERCLNLYKQVISPIPANQRVNHNPADYVVSDMLSDVSNAVLTNGAALALHDALRGVRVPHELSVFMDDKYTVLKPFASPSISAKMLAVMKSGYAMDGTPAANAWKRSIGSLFIRREQRKVLIVMTDGGTNSDAQALGVLNVARTAGIEVYGLGLGCDNLKTLFPKNPESVMIAKDGVIKPLLAMVKSILAKTGKGKS